MKGNNRRKILIVILIILIILLMLFILLGIFRNVYFNKAKEPESIMIDVNKAVVYDADYEYNHKYDEYFKNGDDEETSEIVIEAFGIPVSYNFGMQYVSDLKVPYINLRSEDAKSVNDKLKELYMEYVKNFDDCAGSELGCHQILTYRTYSYQDILSIVVIYGTQSTSRWILSYQTYNFDLDTGLSIEYQDMIERLRYTEEDVLVQFRTSIDSFYKNIYQGSDMSSCKRDTDIDSCSNISVQLLEESITDGTVLFFVNNEGVLNFIAIPYYDGIENGTVNYYLFEFAK